MKYLLSNLLALSVLLLLLPDQIFAQSQPTEAVISNLPADPEPASGKFTLFSLLSGKQVALADSATNAWDIGFKGTSVILNGGKGRKGKGGVYMVTGDYKAHAGPVDETLFAVDQSDDDPAIKSGSGNGWYLYNFNTHEIVPDTSKFLVIRTSNGQFARLKMLSYYHTIKGTPRYYSFSYILLKPSEKVFR
jgi:hypothetical protein